jgi:hypothetical protein
LSRGARTGHGRLVRSGGKREVAQGGNGLAQAEGAADQILLQPVVGQAQQVELLGQLLQALIEVMLHGLGAACARQPKAAEFTAQHDGDQAAKKIQFRKFRRHPAPGLEGEPGHQQHGGATDTRQWPVAQGQHQRRQP